MVVERPEEKMLCAWCERVMVPVSDGFCSQTCYNDNEAANRQ